MIRDLRRVAAVLAQYNAQGEDPMRQKFEERVHRAGMQQSLDVATLRFKKTGEEIIKSLNVVAEHNRKDIEAAQEKITAICKRRELDPKEVLEASQDEQKFQAYSTSLYNNAPQASSALKALEADLNMIRHNTMSIRMTRSENMDLQRIAENLEDDRIFDLTYDELVQLGF
jgi:hypothetical protein